MPLPSRTCSTLDCGRVHFAKGYCERCYRAQRRKGRLSKVPDAPSGPSVVCGWCRTVMVKGTGSESTGICPECFEKKFSDLANTWTSA